MKQLTVGDILRYMADLEKRGMSKKEILALPIYIGDDDELNGIHCGWYTNLVDKNNPDDVYLVELINESSGNFELKDKALLIS